MLKKIAALAGTLAVAGGFALSAPGAASAARSDCPSGAFCAWYMDSYTGTMYHKYVNGTWPEPVKNDDRSWYNHGTYDPGADVIKVYDAAGKDSVTLCIKRGASGHVNGEADDHADMVAAEDRGNYHKWVGGCSSGDPVLD